MLLARQPAICIQNNQSQLDILQHLVPTLCQRWQSYGCCISFVTVECLLPVLSTHQTHNASEREHTNNIAFATSWRVFFLASIAGCSGPVPTREYGGLHLSQISEMNFGNVVASSKSRSISSSDGGWAILLAMARASSWSTTLSTFTVVSSPLGALPVTISISDPESYNPDRTSVDKGA